MGARFGLTLIAITRRHGTTGEERTIIAPGAEEVIRSGDVLALLGSNEQLERLDDLLK